MSASKSPSMDFRRFVYIFNECDLNTFQDFSLPAVSYFLSTSCQNLGAFWIPFNEQLGTHSLEELMYPLATGDYFTVILLNMLQKLAVFPICSKQC